MLSAHTMPIPIEKKTNFDSVGYEVKQSVQTHHRYQKLVIFRNLVWNASTFKNFSGNSICRIQHNMFHFYIL